MKAHYYIGPLIFYCSKKEMFSNPIAKKAKYSIVFDLHWFPTLCISWKEFLIYLVGFLNLKSLQGIIFLKKFTQRKRVINFLSFSDVDINSYIIEGKNSKGYYHFFFEELGAIAFLAQSKNIKLEYLRVYILHEAFSQYQIELLTDLGVRLENIKIIKSGREVIHGRWIVNNKHSNCYVPNIHIVNALRHSILEHVDTKSKVDKVYISRSKANYRKFPVEIEEIRKIGYEVANIFQFEDIHLKEKAVIINSASEIAAIHGAGLSHIIFCKNTSSILEFIPVQKGRFHQYQCIADMLDLNYKSLQCRITEDEYLHIES